MRERPNVLLVVLDTCRADAIEPYGSTSGSTPVLRDLASRGTAVPSAYAPSSWTMPSHASMLSGLMPRTLGLGQAPDGKPTSCRPVVASHAHRWLPELARRDGWATKGVSSNVWVSAASGFDLGFDSFAQVTGSRRTSMAEPGLKARLAWAAHVLRADADAGARDARELVGSWMDGTEPFFWFVNLLECHSPYLPQRPFNDLSALSRLKVAEEARKHLTLHAIWRASLGGLDVPAEALERMRHLYQQAVSVMDAWLGGVLEELDRRHVLDDTIVIVTSDHGENFGDEGLMGHAFSLDERLVRIPLVVAGPGSWPQAGVTSLVDLPRLLADAMGLRGAPYADDPSTPGIAVSTLDPLATRDNPATIDAQQQWGLSEVGVGLLSEPSAAATDGRWKLVRDPRGERAYDLASDPLGLTFLDVQAIPSPVRDQLVAAVEHAGSATAPSAPTEIAGSGDVDVEDLEAQLRLLGYL